MSMATLSAYPNSNPNANSNSSPNFLSPELQPPPSSMSSRSEHNYFDSSPTDVADDEEVPASENFPVGPDSGGVLNNFQSPNLNSAITNPNFVTSLSPPPPIRTSLKPPASVAPNSPNSSLSGAPHSSALSLLHVSFNQDSGCFAAGTDRGFRIYNCDPFREIFRRDFDRGGGIGTVEMLFRCNILALVGGGPEPQYPVNKVMIWDDHQSRCIGELSFRSEVRGVRLRRDRIIVVLEQKVFVYNFADLKLLHQIETIANPKGLCEVSHTAGNLVLVCPGLQKGQVRVEHYASKRTKFIMAHDSRIASFALTQDGSLLATSSTKGTLVRVFNTVDGSLLQEVRRGADRAEIYSLAFSPTAHWLAVSSDKGTVHIFSLKVNSGTPSNESPNAMPDVNSPNSQSGSSLSFIKGVLPKYFSSEWSVAQFRLIEGSQYNVAFGHQKNTVLLPVQVRSSQGGRDDSIGISQLSEARRTILAEHYRQQQVNLFLETCCGTYYSPLLNLFHETFNDVNRICARKQCPAVYQNGIERCKSCCVLAPCRGAFVMLFISGNMVHMAPAVYRMKLLL
ncbi:hypothetical protein V2J09_002228 [Rumex salicifolius]